MVDPRTCVLVVGAGAPWEPAALSVLGSRPGITVLKRCMDVTDLLANVATGQAQVAVISIDAPGLDATAVAHLARYAVQPVAVVPAAGRDDVRDHVRRLGIRATLTEHQLDRLPDVVLTLSREAEPTTTVAVPPTEGRAIAVWGPTGAPGRTTLALGIAGELAARGGDPLVLDVDPWGGAVAQHLGVLDEVSGLLASARSGGGGDLPTRFTGLQRRVGGIRVLTGLPRADRWVEVRDGVVDQLVGLGRRQGDVVLDTGFCLEDDASADYAGRPGRNAMTHAALAAADAIVVVGSADPVGLSRLARGLAELREVTGGRSVHVAVNRWRGRLGWAQSDVARLVSGYADLAGLAFLPDDRDACDKALLQGRTLTESGDSALAKALVPLVDALAGPAARVSVRRRRTAGRARRS